MSPRLRVVAVACGVAAVAGGCGSSSSVIYRGHASGVLMTLTRPSKKSARVGAQPTLAIHFTPAGATVWRHALHAGKLEAFCIWPVTNGGGMTLIDIRLKSKRLTLTLPSDAPSTGAYTCGLHGRTGGAKGSWPWLGYVHGALVAARLSLAHD